jgi:hypothetical protein
MIGSHRLPHGRPSFLDAIKPSRLIGVILAAALLVTGVAAFDAAQTHHATAAQTQASDTIAPATKVGRSGTMLVYEPVW